MSNLKLVIEKKLDRPKSVFVISAVGFYTDDDGAYDDVTFTRSHPNTKEGTERATTEARLYHELTKDGTTAEDIKDKLGLTLDDIPHDHGRPPKITNYSVIHYDETGQMYKMKLGH